MASYSAKQTLPLAGGSIGIYGPLRITLAHVYHHCVIRDIRRHDPCDLEAHKAFYEHTHTELLLESGAR